MLPARANPFRVNRLHALRFRLARETAGDVVERFVAAGCRGALVGRHGTGKTTLLEEMLPLLRGQGYPTSLLRLNEANRSEAGARIMQWLHETPVTHVLVLDGAEQLGYLRWRRLRRASLNYAGLLITTHRPGRLPTLLTTETSVQMLGDLVCELVPENSLSPLFLTSLYQRHRGNLRDCLRELYDRWSRDQAAS